MLNNILTFIEKKINNNDEKVIIALEGGYFNIDLDDENMDIQRIKNLEYSITLEKMIKEKFPNINIMHSLFVNDMQEICSKEHQRCSINNQTLNTTPNIIPSLPTKVQSIYNKLKQFNIFKQKNTRNKASKIIKQIIKQNKILEEKKIFLSYSENKKNILLKDSSGTIRLGYQKSSGAIIVGCPSIMGQHYSDLVTLIINNDIYNNQKILIIDFNKLEEIDVIKEGCIIYNHCFSTPNINVSILNVYENNKEKLQFHYTTATEC